MLSGRAITEHVGALDPGEGCVVFCPSRTMRTAVDKALRNTPAATDLALFVADA